MLGKLPNAQQCRIGPRRQRLMILCGPAAAPTFARTLLDALEEAVIVGAAAMAGRLLVGVVAQDLLAVCGRAQARRSESSDKVSRPPWCASGLLRGQQRTGTLEVLLGGPPAQLGEAQHGVVVLLLRAKEDPQRCAGPAGVSERAVAA